GRGREQQGVDANQRRDGGRVGAGEGELDLGGIEGAGRREADDEGLGLSRRDGDGNIWQTDGYIGGGIRRLKAGRGADGRGRAHADEIGGGGSRIQQGDEGGGVAADEDGAAGGKDGSDEDGLLDDGLGADGGGKRGERAGSGDGTSATANSDAHGEKILLRR